MLIHKQPQISLHITTQYSSINSPILFHEQSQYWSIKSPILLHKPPQYPSIYNTNIGPWTTPILIHNTCQILVHNTNPILLLMSYNNTPSYYQPNIPVYSLIFVLIFQYSCISLWFNWIEIEANQFANAFIESNPIKSSDYVYW